MGKTVPGHVLVGLSLCSAQHLRFVDLGETPVTEAAARIGSNRARGSLTEPVSSQ